jgi:hypothetical protein
VGERAEDTTMTDETSNLILAIVAVLGVLLAVAGAIGNIIAFLFTRLELRAQRNETRELAKLTSDLDHRVHRLAVHLDYEKYRLERVQDLITGLMDVSVGLRQQSKPHDQKLALAVKREMTMPELAALINTIGDGELKALYQVLEGLLVNPIWPLMWNELEYDLGTADELLMQQNTQIKFMHQRILELLEETTQLARDT